MSTCRHMTFMSLAMNWRGHIGVQSPQEVKHARLVLAADSRPYLNAGTPEAQVFRVLDDAGTPMSELKVRIQHVNSCH